MIEYKKTISFLKSSSLLGYFANPELSDVNVIVTDWSVLASVLDYVAAAQHAVSAGKRAGQILGDLLVNKLGADPKKIHAIGHR